MHPLGGNALHDRMVRLTDGYLKGMSGPMSGSTVDTGNIRFVLQCFPFDTVSKLGRTPAKSDHFIVSIPVPKSIVCGMNQYQSTTFFNKFYSRFLGLLCPFTPVIVEYDSLMLSLKRIPFFPFSPFRYFIFIFRFLLNFAKGFVSLLNVIRGIGLGCTNSFN